MSLFSFLCFFFSIAALISLWVKHTILIWSPLILLGFLFGFYAGLVDQTGLVVTFFFLLLWMIYCYKPSLSIFIAIVVVSSCLKLKFIPGFQSLMISSKFAIGLHNFLIGLIPLACFIPLAKSVDDWKKVAKGAVWGVLGIVLMAAIAIMLKIARFTPSFSSILGFQIFCNMFLTCILEEGFYRGFLQNYLIEHFKDKKNATFIAILGTSLLFGFNHIFWAVDAGVWAFSFVASILYGSVYVLSGRIESAILTHWLLNSAHVILFGR